MYVQYRYLLLLSSVSIAAIDSTALFQLITQVASHRYHDFRTLQDSTNIIINILLLWRFVYKISGIQDAFKVCNKMFFWNDFAAPKLASNESQISKKVGNTAHAWGVKLLSSEGQSHLKLHLVTYYTKRSLSEVYNWQKSHLIQRAFNTHMIHW